MDWNPRSSECWANLLGLVRVPLFASSELQTGDNAILLDGRRGTFAFFDVSEDEAQIDEKMLSWAWSANVLHTVAVNSRDCQMRVRRWDTPGRIRTFNLPNKGLAAEELFESLEASPKARAVTVVRHVLDGFRLIRRTLPPTATLEGVQLLNAFLLAAAKAARNEEVRARFRESREYGDVLDLLDASDRAKLGLDALSDALRAEPIGAIAKHFLEPEPRTGCQLEPELLFRHASTDLYQEAHLELERDPQSYFAGIAPTTPPRGIAPKDVRLTPPNLARILVEQALQAFGALSENLVVLDPACGSGVFLQQCLRELVEQQFTGKLSLHGYDISPISSCISKFCLGGPIREALGPQLDVDVNVRTENALTLDPWVDADLILMNPPFVSRDSLTSGELDQVKSVLGDELAAGRVDMAMAFIWKAILCLRDGGVLATVLPAGLLESESGEAWRSAIARTCEVHLLGRFEGYKYFSTSMVETAFAVFRKRPERVAVIEPAVSVLVAQEGREDAAIRFLRLTQHQIRKRIMGVEFYQAQPSEVLTERWTPVRKTQYLLRKWAQDCSLPRVTQLFNVHQGVRTRYKPAFVLKVDAYERLPDDEKRMFRPAAGQRSVLDGRLFPREYVFFPYDDAGLLIQTESELQERVPVYVKTVLNRYRAKLGKGQWWALVRPGTWQYRREQKLLSKTYGTAGDFAFDANGDYAVVQGCAWLWKGADPPPFVQTPLPLAFLAVLNSNVFAVLLEVFCRRVQGGQFELANKFVKSIPLPDLSQVDPTMTSIIGELARFGDIIHNRGLRAIDDGLDAVVARAYGLPDDIASAFADAAEERNHALSG